MDYKNTSIDQENEGNNIKFIKSQHDGSNQGMNEYDWEIDPSIFFYIENILNRDYNLLPVIPETRNIFYELIQTLKDFELASRYISRTYLPTFNKTKVPLNLVELLISPIFEISDYASRIICSLITPKTPEYADDLCENGFLQQCSHILYKGISQRSSAFNFSSIYFIIMSLLKLAKFSSGKCDLILNYISVDILSFYAQTKIIDQGSHDALLQLLIELSLNNGDESITFQLIELVQSLFFNFINKSTKSGYYVLILTYIFSDFQPFFENIQIDKLAQQMIKCLSCNSRNVKKLIYIIPILTNILKFTNFLLDDQLPQIVNFLLDDQLSITPKIVALSCKFIRVYINKNPSINEDIKIMIIKILMSILRNHSVKLSCEILYCILDIVSFVNLETLSILIDQNNLFDFFISALGTDDDDLVSYALQKLYSIFSINDRVNFFKEKFIEIEGIDALNELITTPNINCPQLSQMAEVFLSNYFSED